MSGNDDFYVGYLPKAPPATASLVRTAVAVALVGALAAGVGFVSAQRGFSSGIFEYGVVRTFSGTVTSKPVPILVGKEDAAADRNETFLLVAPFKHGADALVAPFDRKSVALRGTIVYRDGKKMIEVVPESIKATGATPTVADETLLGDVDLVGEIVDSKCWLGVMKPGDGKTHRECASLCIRGGIPPLFVARGEKGSRLEALLTSPDGTPVNDAVLPYVAEPVRVRGALSRRGDLLILRVDPATIERVR